MIIEFERQALEVRKTIHAKLQNMNQTYRSATTSKFTTKDRALITDLIEYVRTAGFTELLKGKDTRGGWMAFGRNSYTASKRVHYAYGLGITFRADTEEFTVTRYVSDSYLKTTSRDYDKEHASRYGTILSAVVTKRIDGL